MFFDFIANDPYSNDPNDPNSNHPNDPNSNHPNDPNSLWKTAANGFHKKKNDKMMKVSLLRCLSWI